MEISCRLAVLHAEYVISEKAVSFAFKVPNPPTLCADFSRAVPLPFGPGRILSRLTTYPLHKGRPVLSPTLLRPSCYYHPYGVLLDAPPYLENPLSTIIDIFKVALRCWIFFTEDLLGFPSGSSVGHLNESPR